MESKWNDERITGFVRETLGCGCPDEVFNKIEIGKYSLGEIPWEATRIVIGDRLLIYVVSPNSLRELTEKIAEVASIGRNDRDSNKYNRFRLVVSDNSIVSEQKYARVKFLQVVGSDEKMHLHFVDPPTVEGVWLRG